jgi:hypothetical protein
MINERLSPIWRRMAGNRAIQWEKIRFRGRAEGVMIGGVTAFVAAVGGASLICYLLMNRRPNRGVRRQGASADSGVSYDCGSSGSDGWNVFSWFSSDTSSDNSGACGDSSGSDSGGGGGDGGGGGGD